MLDDPDDANLFRVDVSSLRWSTKSLSTILAHRDAGASIAQGSIGPEMMEQVTGDLGVAFYTTLLALLQSAVLMFAKHILQEKEERALNEAARYTLRNLVNRLREEGGRGGSAK